MNLELDALNKRANAMGLGVVRGEVLPDSEVPGVPFRFTMGRGEQVRLVHSDGTPLFKFSWSAEEVFTWLTFREEELARS